MIDPAACDGRKKQKMETMYSIEEYWRIAMRWTALFLSAKKFEIIFTVFFHLNAFSCQFADGRSD